MANKGRVLYLLQYLQRCSDEDHPVTTAEIRKELADKGCPATVETVRDDISMIRGCGFDIAVSEKSGQSTTYSYVDRDFSAPELQILIDAVSSSQFITKSKSEQLINKLVSMAGPSHAEELQPNVLSAEYVKARNFQFLYIIQRIHEAIRDDRKISFQYYQLNLNKERVPRHDGKKYIVSPYATLWRYDRYFLIGYSDNTNFIFPLVTITGVQGIYGPCISGFAKKWEGTEEDSFALLEGTKTSFSGYEKVAFETDDEDDQVPPKADHYYDWTYEYNAEKELVIYSCENGKANKLSKDAEVSFEGILLGGCLDVLANLVGTRFDNMKSFNEKNQDVIWVLEACDLTPMSYRRALWNLREAGWFTNAKGFVIGRPRAAFGQNMMGVDQYNAVTEILKDFNVPIIMDADIGHIDPMLPVVMGANAKVSTRNNNLFVDYLSL